MSQTKGINTQLTSNAEVPTRYTAQMAILLQFNDKANYSLRELKDTLMFKEEKLFMSNPMFKINLLKIPSGYTLGASTTMDTILSLNPNFMSKKLKIDLSRVVMKRDSFKEQSEILNTLESDRKMMIQATIVRIMKDTKKCSHFELMAKVIEVISKSFKPNVKVIKNSINILIEKEYLARNEADSSTYEYLS